MYAVRHLIMSRKLSSVPLNVTPCVYTEGTEIPEVIKVTFDEYTHEEIYRRVRE